MSISRTILFHLRFYAAFNLFWSYLSCALCWTPNQLSSISQTFSESDQLLIPHDLWISSEGLMTNSHSIFNIRCQGEILPCPRIEPGTLRLIHLMKISGTDSTHIKFNNADLESLLWYITQSNSLFGIIQVIR